MATELNCMYNALRRYKESLKTNLDTLDLQIQAAIRNFIESHHENSVEAKFKTSMELADVLKNHVTMLHALKVLSQKFPQLEVEAPPSERATSNCYPLEANSSDLASIAIAAECSRSPFTENEPSTLKEERLDQNLNVQPSCPEFSCDDDSNMEDNKSLLKPRKQSSAVDKRQKVSFLDAEEVEYRPQVRGFSPESGTRNNPNTDNRNKNSKKKIFKWKIPPNSENLEVGQVCNICHVVSPGEFYVKNNQAAFEKMENCFSADMNKQHVYVVNKCKTKSEAKLRLGTYCCGFIRNKWYRLEVLDWQDRDSDSDIIVQLIDYGEKVQWDYKHLKPISDVYADIPKMAIRCHLADLVSPDAENKSVWPASSIEFFTRASEICKQKPFLTIFVSNAGDSYGVDLQKVEEPVGYSLGQLLMMHGHASGQKEVSQITTTALSELVLPLRGQCVEVLIVTYISVCHFYVHILRKRKNDGNFNDDFQNLLTAMKIPSAVENYEKFSDVPNVGELLLVQEDPDWYRGRCLNVCENREIEIFLEDFGSTTKKPLTSLRRMKQEFLRVPFQAVECRLHNCKEKKKHESICPEKFFNCIMKMRCFKGIVIDAGKPMKLQLCDPQNHDLGSILRRNGLTN